MAVVTVKMRGSFKNTDRFLKRMRNQDQYKGLESLARRGVDALSSSTPMDTGLSADSWGYEVFVGRREVQIQWTNSSITKTGTPVVILLQYGHGTGTGGYVQGIDFINPALRPVFDEIANAVWKVVTSS